MSRCTIARPSILPLISLRATQLYSLYLPSTSCHTRSYIACMCALPIGPILPVNSRTCTCTDSPITQVLLSVRERRENRHIFLLLCTHTPPQLPLRLSPSFLLAQPQPRPHCQQHLNLTIQSRSGGPSLIAPFSSPPRPGTWPAQHDHKQPPFPHSRASPPEHWRWKTP